MLHMILPVLVIGAYVAARVGWTLATLFAGPTPAERTDAVIAASRRRRAATARNEEHR